MTTVLINGIEYVPKEKTDPNLQIVNDIGATHYAILPDESIVFYKLEDYTIFVWLPLNCVWRDDIEVPYDLILCES